MIQPKPVMFGNKFGNHHDENFKIVSSIKRVYINEQEYKRTQVLSEGTNVIFR